jgi:uncharacterized protein YndB with AHSA1/START domain
MRKKQSFLAGFCAPALTLGLLVVAAGTAQSAEPLWVSPIPDDMNVEFVENHIVIDRPANKVFDFVTTPKYTARWFTGMQGWVAVHGSADKPQQVGDTAIETIAPVPGFLDVPAKVQYTVVALIPGQEWVAAGQRLDSSGKPADMISTIADWSVKPLPNGKSMFIRIFEMVRPEAHTPGARRFAIDAGWSQEVLMRLKEVAEKEIPKK